MKELDSKFDGVKGRKAYPRVLLLIVVILVGTCSIQLPTFAAETCSISFDPNGGTGTGTGTETPVEGGGTDTGTGTESPVEGGAGTGTETPVTPAPADGGEAVEAPADDAAPAAASELVDGKFAETREITVEIYDRGNDGGSNPEDNDYTRWIQEQMLEKHNVKVNYQKVPR